VPLQDPLGHIQCLLSQIGRFGRTGSRHPALYNRAMDKKPAQPEAPTGATGHPPAPELSEKQRRYLRGLAHPLGAVIRLGKEGLTDAVVKETTRALHDHELIKVKAPGGDREARDALFVSLAERSASALVHRIGNVAVLYRPHPDLKRILIPD
jgi:RNA-binding protein